MESYETDTEQLHIAAGRDHRSLSGGAAAQAGAGHPDCTEHCHFHHDSDDHHEHLGGAGVLYLPLPAADNDPVPPGPQRILHTPDPLRGRRCGYGNQILRYADYPGEYCHRNFDFLNHCTGAIYCDHQRSGARLRGGRPLHAGRHARKADGHRRGFELRPY